MREDVRGCKRMKEETVETYNEFECRLYKADTKEDTVRLCVNNLAHAKEYLMRMKVLRRIATRRV